jgi:hypothetical protein
MALIFWMCIIHQCVLYKVNYGKLLFRKCSARRRIKKKKFFAVFACAISINIQGHLHPVDTINYI